MSNKNKNYNEQTNNPLVGYHIRYSIRVDNTCRFEKKIFKNSFDHYFSFTIYIYI